MGLCCVNLFDKSFKVVNIFVFVFFAGRLPLVDRIIFARGLPLKRLMVSPRVCTCLGSSKFLLIHKALYLGRGTVSIHEAAFERGVRVVDGSF